MDGRLTVRGRTEPGTTYQFCAPVVAITSRAEVIESLHRQFGGKVSGDTLYWRLRERRGLLKAIIPYLRIKRRQAELLLEFIEQYSADGHGYTPEQSKRRSAIIRQVEQLNEPTVTHDLLPLR